MVEFRKDHNNSQKLIDYKIYFPWNLIAAASCIGNGLDSPDIRTVVHVGFPTLIVDAVQEMGCCDRGNANHSSNVNKYIILANLTDYIYLNKNFITR